MNTRSFKQYYHILIYDNRVGERIPSITLIDPLFMGMLLNKVATFRYISSQLLKL